MSDENIINSPKNSEKRFATAATPQDQVASETKSIRVAPPSTSEWNDRRAVRCRTRRERPRKIRLEEVRHTYDTEPKVNQQRLNFFVPDVESFVSFCIPGVSFASTYVSKNQESSSCYDEISLAPRRVKLIRKRSLPLLAFLSSTSLAAAEQKRRKEEKEQQETIAQEEARRIAGIDYSDVFGDNDNVNAKTQNVSLEERMIQNEDIRAKLPCTSPAVAAGCGNNDVAIAECKSKNLTPPLENPDLKPSKTTTITMESTSTVLMPPLLESFLMSLKKAPRKKCS